MDENLLHPQRLALLLRQFKDSRGDVYSIQALGFFGSFARNEAGAESDVDIVFETDAPNLFKTARMREELEELLGRPVDIIRLRGLTNHRLKAHIEKEAIYV